MHYIIATVNVASSLLYIASFCMYVLTLNVTLEGTIPCSI